MREKRAFSIVSNYLVWIILGLLALGLFFILVKVLNSRGEDALGILKNIFRRRS